MVADLHLHDREYQTHYLITRAVHQLGRFRRRGYCCDWRSLDGPSLSVAFFGIDDLFSRVDDLAPAKNMAGYQKDFWLFGSLIQTWEKR